MLDREMWPGWLTSFSRPAELRMSFSVASATFVLELEIGVCCGRSFVRR